VALRDDQTERLRNVVGDDTFRGRFEIVREAGGGGMGRVYEAIDLESGLRVAIKVLANNADRERFASEVEALEQLEHPLIVRYVRHGTMTAGEPYLAMEWLTGENLAERLARGTLSVADTLVLGERIASALAFVHAAGMVHRDLKPSNVYLVDREVTNARLIDFGVAKLATRDLTATGQLVGTPGYMAPEQARGGKIVHASVDLFALGCVLYEALAGQPPFAGTDVIEILARLLLEQPTPIAQLVPGVPPRLAHLIGALLAKDPEHRVEDAESVRAELALIRVAVEGSDGAALAALPSWARTAPEAFAPTLQEAPPRKRRRGMLVALAIAVAGVVAFGAWLAWPAADSAQPASHDGRVPEHSDAVVAVGPPCTNDIVTGCAARCADGDAEACLRSGRVLYTGSRGVTIDRVAGMAAYVRGCELESNPSCVTAAGILLRDEHRQPADVLRAKEFLELACQRSFSQACGRLGSELLPGGAFVADPVRALDVLGVACAASVASSCIQLKHALAKNTGDAGSRARAEAVYQAACKRGVAADCSH
jgi:predicted Ser/Thr protein kinase